MITCRHNIGTGESPTVKSHLYPVSSVERNTIQDRVTDRLTQGVIHEPSNPWPSRVILIKKKNVLWRSCVDYRRLNKVTRKDACPLLRIDDTLDVL